MEPDSLFDYATDSIAHDISLRHGNVLSIQDIFKLPKDVIDKLPCRVFGDYCGNLGEIRSIEVPWAHFPCVLDAARYSARDGASYAIARNLDILLLNLYDHYTEKQCERHAKRSKKIGWRHDPYYIIQVAVQAGLDSITEAFVSKNAICTDTLNGIIAHGIYCNGSEGFRIGFSLGKAFTNKNDAEFLCELSCRTCSDTVAAGLRQAYLEKFRRDDSI